MSSKPKQRPDTRELLLKAAIKEFSEKGFEKARISDIVASAGYSQRTFYIYFESKDAIFKELLTEWEKRLANKFDIEDEKDYKQNILNRWIQIIEFMAQDPEYSKAVYFKSPYFEETRQHIFEHLMGILIKEQSHGFLRTSVAVEILAESILSGIEGIAYRHVINKKETDIPKLAEQMVDIYIYGVGI
ncbi:MULTISPECIES: TetR/AcrR family transcriptional regulator [Desulfitobacterium]|uniref:Transcriptional regulator n=1 Tax=Desulfitobacterium dehalogenans (strain ATCC 51507 / DSM 9161 / JW/IU-DC1) TaxID=756499 RepID=I4A7L7_DESDJ|nr:MULTISPECIES: TetR/AcrR family transcriptional regulator [Desulfitobacterium]AFL99951.1 transcriptional regulator [Desulfitobacterium dehalogenans ATCC 51507]